MAYVRFLPVLFLLLALLPFFGNHLPLSINTDSVFFSAVVLPAAITDTDLLGAFTIPEFSVRFKICRSLVYAEAKAGRLRLSKIRSRTVITRGEAARYQRMLEDEAAAEVTA
jgi:hypothetical protein